MAYANNPHATYPLGIDISLSNDDLYRDIKNVVRNVMCANEAVSKDETWTLARDEDISVKVLSGGLTNSLFLVSNNIATDAKVILRTFGTGSELFIDRDQENLVFAALSQAGFGPSFLGLIQGGRIEGYIPSSSLHFSQLKHESVYSQIARAVSDLHSYEVSVIKTEKIWLWDKISQFFNIIDDIKFDDPMKAESLAALRVDVMRGELSYIQHTLTKIHATLKNKASTELNEGRLHAFELALSHNDLHSGNILASMGNTEHIESVSFIDYEYAAYNYRAYDLADFFCEFGGLDINMKANFPSEDVRNEFVKTYLKGSLQAYIMHTNMSI
ncbi:hypothetical protein EON65_22605 [archaeon]|nr:MAG: hypothetical protein EON65_22605 [archaeon]